MLRHVLQQEVIQRVIDFGLYLIQYTPCICLIVLILRSSEFLILINTCVKFHSNPILSSWGVIFNVPECIFRKGASQLYCNKYDSKINVLHFVKVHVKLQI